jgi:hypothetical protein
VGFEAEIGRGMRQISPFVCRIFFWESTKMYSGDEHHFITFDLITIFLQFTPLSWCSEQPCPRQSLSFDQTTPSQQSWRDWLLDLQMLFGGRNWTHLGHQHQRFV